MTTPNQHNLACLVKEISCAESAIIIKAVCDGAPLCEIKELACDIKAIGCETNKIIFDECHNKGDVLGDVSILNGDLIDLFVDATVATRCEAFAACETNIIGCATSEWICQPLVFV